MPVARYKVWDWGPPVGDGVTDSRHVFVNGIAKEAGPDQPYLVTDELVCSSLGRLLGLPMPPGFLVSKDGTPHFVSLNFNLAGEALPNADPVALVAAHPVLACGIVLFDAWIVNPDRHPRNLSYNTVTGDVTLFDHSHCLYAGRGGRAHLEANRDRLGIGGHCLARNIEHLDGFQQWQRRLDALPAFMIDDALQHGLIDPFGATDAKFCLDYLLDRRARLPEMIRSERASFPGVAADLWDAGTGGEA